MQLFASRLQSIDPIETVMMQLLVQTPTRRLSPPPVVANPDAAADLYYSVARIARSAIQLVLRMGRIIRAADPVLL